MSPSGTFLDYPRLPPRRASPCKLAQRPRAPRRSFGMVKVLQLLRTPATCATTRRTRCNDDIERCVKGTRRSGCSTVRMSRTFGLSSLGQTSLSSLIHGQTPYLAQADQYLTLRFGKKIRRNNNGPCVQQHNKWESFLNVDGQITSVTMKPHPGIGCIILFQSRKKSKV
jgi:hypothetical protein